MLLDIVLKFDIDDINVVYDIGINLVFFLDVKNVGVIVLVDDIKSDMR